MARPVPAHWCGFMGWGMWGRVGWWDLRGKFVWPRREVSAAGVMAWHTLNGDFPYLATRRATCFLAPLCGAAPPCQVRHRRRFLRAAKNHAVATRRLLGQAPRHVRPRRIDENSGDGIVDNHTPVSSASTSVVRAISMSLLYVTVTSLSASGCVVHSLARKM